MTTLALRSSSEGVTRNLGRLLGRVLKPGVTVFLRGDLGAGKTVLVRGVGDALGAKGVRSPSFTLVNEEDVLDVRIEALDEGARRLSLSAAGTGAEELLQALAEAVRAGCPGVEVGEGN